MKLKFGFKNENIGYFMDNKSELLENIITNICEKFLFYHFIKS